MITNEFRPKTFDEVAGQELNIRICKSIIKNPEVAPRSIIFQGGFGCGKSTMARILARGLNCTSSRVRPCGVCENCKQDINASTYYSEYDSTVVGNVEKIKELRDTFYYHQEEGYKVILFDECHVASRQAQSALLKVIEEAPPKCFFLFATTDIDKLLPTIRSRSIELVFNTLSEVDVIDNLRSVAEKLNVEVPEQILKTIYHKSQGHMRNAHMLLDQYIMIGEDDFKELVRSSREFFLDYFKSMATLSRPQLFQALDNLVTFPIADLKQDFQQVLLEMVSTLVGVPSQDPKVLELVKSLGGEILKIYKNCVSDWVLGSFISDEMFKATMMSLWTLFTAGRQR